MHASRSKKGKLQNMIAAKNGKDYRKEKTNEREQQVAERGSGVNWPDLKNGMLTEIRYEKKDCREKRTRKDKIHRAEEGPLQKRRSIDICLLYTSRCV